MSTVLENQAANLTDELNQYLTLLRAHDSVHPGRNDCGGVGGCLLLRAEVDQENEITDLLTQLAGYGTAIESMVVKARGR
jgi:hypothetical protein